MMIFKFLKYIGVYLHHLKFKMMTRQSITLAEKNDEWLKQQVADQEFNSKSEVVNHLIKKARTNEEYDDFVRLKLEKAEKSGFSTLTKEELLTKIKSKYTNV
jgi:antitoxin ParD1/3/4